VRFVLATFGTRGETDPYIALAIELQRRGHEVLLIATEEYESRARAFGIHAHCVPGSIKASLESHEHRDVWAGRRDAAEKWIRTFFLPTFRRLLDAIWESSQRAEVLVLHSGLMPAQRVAEIHHIPVFIASPYPVLSATRHFPNPFFPQLSFVPFFNRLSYTLNRLYPLGQYRVVADWYRTALRVSPPTRYHNYLKQNGRQLPVLYCYSEMLIPSPPDWDRSICVSGYWSLPVDTTWLPPQALLDYLQSGPPPVFIGFSSTIGPSPEKVTELVAKAIREIPHRVIVGGGWGGLHNVNLPDSAFFVENVPHQWLFPYLSVVVHHGGTGTLAAAIKAGRPSVICPLGAEQAFWAAAAHRKGVAPPFRMQHKLTAEWLVNSVKTTLSTPSMARAAEELGHKLREEDSFGKAVEFIERNVEAWTRNAPAI